MIPKKNERKRNAARLAGSEAARASKE